MCQCMHAVKAYIYEIQSNLDLAKRNVTEFAI